MPLFAPVAAPTDILDASLAAHAALKRFRCHITLDSRSSGKRSQTTYDVAVDGQTVLLRVRHPRADGMERSDRSLLFGPSKLIAYDAVADERLTRQLPPNTSKVGRIVFVLGPLDDMLRNVLSPTDLKGFYVSLKNLQGWVLRRDAAGSTLVRQTKAQGGQNRIVLGLSGARLLRRLDVTSPGSEVHWTFDFAAGGRVALSPPRSAREVSAFTVAPVPPHYASAEARRVTMAMLDANRRFTRGTIGVDSDEGRLRIAVDGRRMREEGGRLSFAYDGRTLTTLDRRRNLFYRGVTTRSVIPDIIAALGGRTDPICRQILQGKTPYQEILSPRMTVSLAGRMESGGVSCDILRLSEPAASVSLFVRRDNHLVDSASTDILDRSGHAMTSSTRRFHYGPMHGASFSLTPKPGQKVLKLPKIVLR